MHDAGLPPSMPGKLGRVMAAIAIVASGVVVTANPALSGPGTYGDDFAQLDYDGSDGTIDWSATPWVEEFDGGDPTAGVVQVVNDPSYCETDNCLQLTGDGSVKDRAATRRVDLAGAGFATLSYDYLRFNWWSCRVRVQSRPNASSGWSLLATYPVSGGTDPAPISASHSIPLADISATTEVRFIVDEWCDPERFYVDNVLIDTDLVVANSAPTEIALAPAAIDENVPLGTVVGTLTTTDPDLTDTHTYALAAGIGDTDNGRFVIVGDEVRTAAALNFETLGGSLSIRVESTDSGVGSLTYEEALPITLSNLNEPPVPDLIVDQYPDEGDLVSLTATATDPDVPGDGLLWTKDSGPGAVDASGNYTWTTAEADGPGTYTVVLRVTDDGIPNMADTASFQITVAEINAPPVLTDPGAQSDVEGEAVSLFIGTADTDVPANELLWSATGLPPGLGIDPATGEISGILDFSASTGSPHSVTVTVTDDGSPTGTDGIGFVWTVADREAMYLIASTGGAAGGDDLLTIVDPNDSAPATNEVDVGTGTGTVNIRGADLQPGLGVLYASDGGQLGTVDKVTGVFTPTASAFGTGNGSQGAITFDNVVGVAFDTSTGDLYGVQRRPPGTEPLLFRISLDGSHVPSAFGGADYVRIQKQATRIDVSDIAFDPTDGQLYAMHNDMSSNYRLATIDKATGTTATMGGSEDDIQGLAFDTSGQLWGTTATGGVESLWQIDKSSGAGSNPRPIDNGGSYDAIATPTPLLGNDPPVLDPVGNRVGDEGTMISFIATASDADLPAQALTFSLTGEPTGATITAGGAFSWTPTEAQGPGVYAFDVVVTDNGVPNLADSETITVTVNEVADSHGYYLKGDGVPAASLTLVVPTLPALPNYDPGRDSSPGLVVKKGGSGFDEVDPTKYQIWVAAAGPIILDGPASIDFWSAMKGFDATKGGVVDIGLLECDPDGTNCTVISQMQVSETPWSGGQPSWVLKTASFGSLSHAVPPGRSLAVMFVVNSAADDDMWFAYDTIETASGIDITTGVNGAPTDISLAPSAVDENVPTATTVGTLTTTDPDLADTHTYAMVAGPGGADNGMFAIVGDEVRTAAPLNFETLGTSLSIRVETTDSGVGNFTFQEALPITLNDLNESPTADPIVDQLPNEGATVSLTATASDPDVPADTLTWTRVSGPGSVDGAGNYSWPTTEADGSSTSTVVLRVADNGVPSLSDTVSFDITVAETNQAPTITPIGDQLDAENAVVSLPVLATDPDLPVNALLYSATGLPAGISISPSSGLISGTIDFSAAAGSPYSVEVSVTDNGSPNRDAVATFSWTVTNTNRSPVFDNDLLDRVDGEGAAISLSAGATDPDLDTLLYTAVGLPPGLSIDPGSGLISGTIGFGAAAGSPYAFEVTVTDNGLPVLDAVDTFAWTVVNTNRNPAFDADLPDRTDSEGGVISLSAAATDPDLDTLLYTATGLPPGLSVDPSSGLISGTIDYTAAASSPYAIAITVTDNGTPNLNATDTFAWTVTNTNRNPIFDTDLPDRVDAEASVVSLAAGATDPDFETLLYSATGLPPGLTIDPGSGLISGTISFTAAAGSPYAITITVADNGVPNLDATDTFTWTVTETNRNPVFDSDLADRTDAEGAVVVMSAAATDPDLDTLAYSATGLPPGFTINPVTGLIAGTMSFTAASGSPYAVAVTVTDSGTPNLAAVDMFTWTVSNLNRGPVFDTDLLDRAAGEATAVSLPSAATDPDLDTLTYSAIGLPPGLSIDPGSGLISGTISFAAAVGSPYGVAITVTDNGVPNLSAVDSFTWTVINSNRAPIFDSDMGDRTDREDTVISLSAAATDPDANTVSYSATGLPPGLSVNRTTGLIAGTIDFSAAAGSPYAVVVTATDNGTPSLSAVDTFSWTVTNTNRPPALHPMADIVGAEQTPISFTATGTDPDLDELVFTLAGAPPGAVIEAGSGVFTWTPTEAQGPGTYSMTVVVTDTGSPPLTHSQIVRVTAAEANRPPSLAPIVDRQDGEGSAVDLTVAGTDPDLPANTLTYRAVGLPLGVVIDPISGVISGTVDAEAAAGSPYTVEITVSDVGSPELNAVHTFTWTVANVDAPAGSRKKTVVDALVGFEVEAIAEPDARPIRRGLVLMGATASASAAALRWPLGILLVLLMGFVTIGRIGLYPILRRGDRFTGVIGFYDAELEFGLVTPDDDSREIFIHANAFSQRQRQNLEAGTRVRYRLFIDDNRPCGWAATIIDRPGTKGRTSP